MSGLTLGCLMGRHFGQAFPASFLEFCLLAVSSQLSQTCRKHKSWNQMKISVKTMINGWKRRRSGRSRSRIENRELEMLFVARGTTDCGKLGPPDPA
ncbi:hypothetical protein BDV09DRAFT_179878 [Aspergillus tetrazonus]